MSASDTAADYPVGYELRDSIAWVTLERPDRLNAVTPSMYEGIEASLTRAEEDDARIVVLRGAGSAFSVGADMKEHDARDRTAAERRAYAWQAQEACRTVQEHPQPVVAAVHGYAIGAGAELALSADFIYIEETAEMRFPEVALGTYVGGGVTYTLARRVGQAKAKELVLSAAKLDGTEAANLGVASEAIPSEDFDDAVTERAEGLASHAPISMRLAKERFDSGETDRESVLVNEVEALLTCMESDDWVEGVEAFAEDREPEFGGR